MSDGCLALVIVGGVLEILGFGFVAWEIARIQRQEFGTPQIFLRIRGWVRRVLRRPQVVHLGVADGISAAGSLSARLRVRSNPGDTLEARIEALEKNFGHLEKELDERAAELDQAISRIEDGQRQMRAELDEQHREREERRRDSLRVTVKLQTVGLVLFVIGAVLSVLGNALTC